MPASRFDVHGDPALDCVLLQHISVRASAIAVLFLYVARDIPSTAVTFLPSTTPVRAHVGAADIEASISELVPDRCRRGNRTGAFRICRCKFDILKWYGCRFFALPGKCSSPPPSGTFLETIFRLAALLFEVHYREKTLFRIRF